MTTEAVEALPRRTAHALHALVVASRDMNAPVTAQEALLYDSESFSARSTAGGLRRGSQLGLCMFDGRYWWPTGAYDIASALEDRFLRDTA